MRFALLLSYDGTHFCGWQVQKNARTVQGELEGAAEKLFGCKTKVAGSGRTDAGVHALGQVCHLDAQTPVPPERLREAFNALLPPDVRVLKSAAAPEGFDCTRGAKKKTYVYTAYSAPCELPLFDRYAVRLKEKPDLGKMRSAAKLIEGEHDFKAFCAAGSSAKTSVRTVYSVSVSEREEGGAAFYGLAVCGNGFLYNMVRILAGEIFEIGCGRRREAEILRAFETGRRETLAKTMPAKGLKLLSVDYGVPLFCGTEE